MTHERIAMTGILVRGDNQIISRAFRENLEWAVVVPGDGEISPEVTKLVEELSARGITIHDSGFGSW